MRLFGDDSDPRALRVLGSTVNATTSALEVIILLTLVPKLVRYVKVKWCDRNSNAYSKRAVAEAEADFSVLRRLQVVVILVTFVHNFTIFASDWIRDSPRNCDVLKRFVTVFKCLMFILYFMFLYYKAYAVSFGSDEKSVVRKMFVGMIFGYVFAAFFGPFFSSGRLVESGGDVFCVYDVVWYYSLVGLIAFMTTTALFAYRFMASIRQTYLARMGDANGAQGGQTAGSLGLRRVLVVNLISVVVMLLGIILFMLYMVVSMFLMNWKMHFFVGTVSCLESFLTISSMVMCTMDWEGICGSSDSRSRQRQVVIESKPNSKVDPEDCQVIDLVPIGEMSKRPSV
eukprot:TRINITY_DN2276_c0_g1_i1.p1 TRINITY_DN2276_c0_g1~~TRINITY_DN2276_c0_g1_i1.p1  ORF type:complete len:342 (-),score=74.05 TRINITY_DN2276_c0_g1_i1:17-1042(-)